MTIREILNEHKLVPAYQGPATCTCEEWESRRTGLNSRDQHRAHVAEVLDKHMQEREYRAWESGYEDGAVHAVGIRAHIDGLTKHDPKRPANPYRKDVPNGR